MIFLFCTTCEDLVKLDNHVSKCSCGENYGYYPRWDDIYVSKDGIPIGIETDPFFKAVKGDREGHKNIKGFVFDINDKRLKILHDIKIAYYEKSTKLTIPKNSPLVR